MCSSLRHSRNVMQITPCLFLTPSFLCNYLQIDIYKTVKCGIVQLRTQTQATCHLELSYLTFRSSWPGLAHITKHSFIRSCYQTCIDVLVAHDLVLYIKTITLFVVLLKSKNKKLYVIISSSKCYTAVIAYSHSQNALL